MKHAPASSPALAATAMLAALLAGCATKGPLPPAVEIQTVTVTKEVMRPCPVTIPQKPALLARPLPKDAVQLAALLAAKLIEWAGPGGYGERADTALKTCTAPVPEGTPTPAPSPMPSN